MLPVETHSKQPHPKSLHTLTSLIIPTAGGLLNSPVLINVFSSPVSVLYKTTVTECQQIENLVWDPL